MKNLFKYYLLILALGGIMFTGCKKTKEASLSGTYTRMMQYGGISYNVELQFADDGTFSWSPVDSIPGHTPSTAKYEKKNDNQIRIYDDVDCGTEATYSYTVTSDNLTLTADTDDCTPRVIALTGLWSRK